MQFFQKLIPFLLFYAALALDTHTPSASDTHKHERGLCMNVTCFTGADDFLIPTRVWFSCNGSGLESHG